DRTKFSLISQLVEGGEQTIKVNVLVCGQRKSWRRRSFSITEAIVEDSSARLSCVWFNQPYLKQYLKPGVGLILYGKVERYAGKIQMTNPEFEIVSPDADQSLNIGRIVPVYPAVAGLGQRSLRRMIKECLDKYGSKLEDFLPYDLRSRNQLLNLSESLANIHFPETELKRKDAYTRLAFEEFFIFQLPLAIRKFKKKDSPGIAHKADAKLAREFIKALPFELTDSQKQVVKEITADMASPQPMQRLLQGDVGSGKTVVATIAGMIAIDGNYQVAFMVPTEILAQQHYEKIKFQISNSRLPREIKVGLLTGSLKEPDKKKLLAEIKSGEIDLLIGTHALLEGNVEFRSLGLVVIDEQHRFGVAQRAKLPQKAKHPDVLIMTATPIPRTLAITLYADLDVSEITEMPIGRKPIKTAWITSFKREWLYEFIRKTVSQGRQVYVVYPIIEESFALDLLSAKKMYAEFRENVFKEFNVGLIHGKLKQKEQDRIMSEFKSCKLQILIATTVLEVGIDVANATLMVIEEAHRFGLSQLHQLRGRVGRSELESFCVVVSDAAGADAKARLASLVKYIDGFKIAEQDLKIRGPGDYFGTRQHGLTGLRIGNPLTQMQLLKKAKEETIRILDLDPRLESKPNLALKEKLRQRFPEYEKMILVG
ncbi:MAG: ATP-dependent DNA helicase RecG, partial [Candidatus Omnitrophica bacterium]|nr:ATP-dependent DNA helicase RecG [Candidatus Omnitrophota bacterium]